MESNENLEIINSYLNLLDKYIYNTELDKFGMITDIEISRTGIYLKAYYDRIHSSEMVLFEDFEKGKLKFTIITGENVLTKEQNEKYKEKQINDIKQAFGDKFSDDMIMYIEDEERKRRNKEDEQREIQRISMKMINLKKLSAEVFYDDYVCTEGYKKYANGEITETELLYIACNHLCEEIKRLKDENLNYFIEKFRYEQAEFLVDYAKHKNDVDSISENKIIKEECKESMFKILDDKLKESDEVSENE